ncbi:MAG TPA: CRTAC1 family protein [Longimicrobium sp.]
MSAPAAPIPPFARRHARRLAAAAAVLALYGMAHLPEPSGAERRELAARFAFARAELPPPEAVPERTIRAVHPDLAHFAGWISSVGAAAALHDLDGDGLPNDACWVDVRADRVFVAPVPGSGARYPGFALDPAPLPYDATTTAPMGCLPGDLDEDGRADLVVYFWGRTPIAFLRRASSSTPAADAYERVEVMPSPGRWYTNAATFADVDGDGHADLLVGNYFPDGARVLHARGGGAEHMQASMSRSANGGKNRVLLWAAPGRFREAADALPPGTATGWTLAIGAADLDGDLRPEIYFANDFGPDRLLHNRSAPGRPRFAVLEGRRGIGTPHSKVLGRDSFKGMGVDFGDLNGDGLLDLYVSNIAGEYALEESHFAWVSTGRPERMREGVAPYADRSEALGLSRSGWGWDSRLADLDNDGVPEALQALGFLRGDINRWPQLHELAMGNDQLLAHPAVWPRFGPGDDLSGRQHLMLFARARDGRYYDVAEGAGVGQRQVTRGIAVADVDGDGRLDFAAANQWDRSYVYRNQSPETGASLVLDLLFPVDGRARTTVRPGLPRAGEGYPALGASARVTLPDGRVLVAQVDGGNGHSGKRAPQLHFGLGDHPPGIPLRVEVAWRDAAGVHREALALLPGRHTVVLGRRPDARTLALSHSRTFALRGGAR